MAIGSDLLAIPDMTLQVPQMSQFANPMNNLGAQLTAGYLAPSQLATMPLPEDDDMALEAMAEQMASEKRRPPDWKMMAQAIAGALPKGSPAPTGGGSGGSFGSAPQFQMQVNPFTATPKTGTTNPNLGNLLKGIAN